MARMSEGLVKVGQIVRDGFDGWVTEDAVVRKFRPRQKGIECSVKGCTGWCVSNDLCAKHSMQRHRRTEKGRAYVRAYNKRYKKLSVEKICKCGLRFETARANQIKCSDCSSGKKVDTQF